LSADHSSVVGGAVVGGAVGRDVGPVVVGDGVVGFSVESLVVGSLVGGEFFFDLPPAAQRRGHGQRASAGRAGPIIMFSILPAPWASRPPLPPARATASPSGAADGRHCRRRQRRR
jgi:hypothetical protein